jgi:ParB family transcriptional regulator, chromosome partitioning protein
MSDTPQRRGLGRGLAALIPQEPGSGLTYAEIPLSAIAPNPRQPRGVFDEDELEGLATSIRDLGLLQPLVVRQAGDDRYELIAGERRLRASRIAGLTTVPSIIRDTDDTDLLKEALVENIHRVQLNPLEEAAAYQQLLEDFEVTQEELARRLGKSRPTITNGLRLLTLPPAVQRKVAAGVLSAGHAKAVLALSDKRSQEALADRIVAEGLSVRATEEAVRLRVLDETQVDGGGGDGGSGGGRGGGSRQRVTAPALVDLQDDLSDALQARVKISMGARRGKLTVQFGSIDDLERIVGVIANGLQQDIRLDQS